MSNITLFSNNTIPINGTNIQGCIINGNSDIYGLGIRLGFYLQWYSTLLASAPKPGSGQLASDEAQGLGYSNIIFSVATFIGLIGNTSILQLSEIYVILLLVFGYHYYFIPDTVIKLIRQVQLHLRGEEGDQDQHGWVYNLLIAMLFCAMSCFQLWFWGDHFQHKDTSTNCPDFGFAFVKVDLHNKGFRGFNILYFSLLLVLSLYLVWSAWSLFVKKRNDAKGSLQKTLHKTPSRESNQNASTTHATIRSALFFIFTTIMIIAVEVSISWNMIQGVSTLISAGQLIPFLLGVGAMLRVLYVGFRDWSSDQMARDHRYCCQCCKWAGVFAVDCGC